MKMSSPLIDELTREAETTRRVLERVPQDKLAWKPHARSMSLGQLALHGAQTPGAVAQPAAARRACAVGLRSERRRESVHLIWKAS
jgi:hypothetical protein